MIWKIFKSSLALMLFVWGVSFVVLYIWTLQVDPFAPAGILLIVSGVSILTSLPASIVFYYSLMRDKSKAFAVCMYLSTMLLAVISAGVVFYFVYPDTESRAILSILCMLAMVIGLCALGFHFIRLNYRLSSMKMSD